MVTPSARKQGVRYLLQAKKCSERSACHLVGLSRSSMHYDHRKKPDEDTLRTQIAQQAKEKKRAVYRQVHAYLCRKGWHVNVKRVYRIWCEEGLQLPRKRPKRSPHGRVPGEQLRQATHKDHVWSYDFLEDRTEQGRRLRMLTILDEYTRECLGIYVAPSFTGQDVANVFEWLFLTRGTPEYIRSDNGPEFVCQHIQTWLEQAKVKTLYITPGSPWENGKIESFHEKLRNECLNMELFMNGKEAQEVVEQWRQKYNEERPHSALGYLTPSEFAQQSVMNSAKGYDSLSTRHLDNLETASKLPIEFTTMQHSQ